MGQQIKYKCLRCGWQGIKNIKVRKDSVWILNTMYCDRDRQWVDVIEEKMEDLSSDLIHNISYKEYKQKHKEQNIKRNRRDWQKDMKHKKEEYLNKEYQRTLSYQEYFLEESLCPIHNKKNCLKKIDKYSIHCPRCSDISLKVEISRLTD